MLNEKLFSKLRQEYHDEKLMEDNIPGSPFTLFEMWFQKALKANVPCPDAMTVATTTENGTPDARIILLKEVTSDGFVFYSNYESPKAKQIEFCSSCTLLFWWPQIRKQVRIYGNVEKTTKEKSQKYFQTRPKGSQLSAYASKQSSPVADRQELEENFTKTEKEFEKQDIPCPKHWGGYILKANSFEFWQGRSDRMHDRIKFILENQKWRYFRLSP